MGSKGQKNIDFIPLAKSVLVLASVLRTKRYLQLDPKFLRNQRWARKIYKKHSMLSKRLFFTMQCIMSNGIFHPIGVRGDKIEIETLILVMNKATRLRRL